MLASHVRYLGRALPPADLAEFEIAHFLFLQPQRSAVLTRYRDSLRLGAGLQMDF
jgi:hypothetical protein